MQETRKLLLEKFYIKAAEHYNFDVPSSVNELLHKLLPLVSEAAFEDIGPRETGIIVFNNSITDEGTDDGTGTIASFVYDVLGFHFNTPTSLPLTIMFSSPGGSVSDGMVMISVLQKLRREQRKLHIHVTGEACSMGNQILQTADHRSIEPTGILMLHEIAWGVEHATASSHKTESEFWAKQQRVLMSLWCSRTGRPMEYYTQKTSNKDWWLTSQEALAENLVDEVVEWAPYPEPKPLPILSVPTKKARAPKKKVITE
jgi:ATP-dependent protease ClpP protease subunit